MQKIVSKNNQTSIEINKVVKTHKNALKIIIHLVLFLLQILNLSFLLVLWQYKNNIYSKYELISNFLSICIYIIFPCKNMVHKDHASYFSNREKLFFLTVYNKQK